MTLLGIPTAGAFLGPFFVRPERGFGAYFEVLTFDGATSITAAFESSLDGYAWQTVDVVGPVATTNTREMVTIGPPLRQARIRFTAAAPGGWTGTALASVEVSSDETVQAIEERIAAREAAERAESLAALRAQLGFSDPRPLGRSAAAFGPFGT
jgi:hypothetical protein